VKPSRRLIVINDRHAHQTCEASPTNEQQTNAGRIAIRVDTTNEIIAFDIILNYSRLNAR